MRIVLTFIAMILCFSDISTLVANSDVENDRGIIDLGKKFYVNVEQVDFANQKIYIGTEGIVYETPALFSDENGYYILQIAQSGHCAWYEWECSNSKCKACNLRGIDYKCRSCGRPISR